MARYIDADELYKATQKRIAEANEARMAVVDDEFLDLINDAFTEDVAPRAEWISVEERLPDCEYGSETEALLFRLKTGTVEAGYFGTGGRFRDKYFRCYHHANEGWDAKDVTHWMPLPEPPKGD
jgi:hypothetical protein